MKVILLKPVPELGDMNAVVDVSDEHAKDFLFPEHAAIEATPEALKKLKEQEKAPKASAFKANEKEAGIAGKLEGFELTFQANAGADGRLDIPLSPVILAKALKKQGFDVDPSCIKLEEPIKEPGEHSVLVEFGSGFESHITVRVETK